MGGRDAADRQYNPAIAEAANLGSRPGVSFDRMKTSRQIRVGILCIVFGIGAYFVVYFWYSSRTWTPVDMPISLSPCEIQTPEFSTNMNAFYRLDIAARTNKGIPSDTLDCLLGGALDPKSCAQHFVIRADWILMSDGKTVAKGSSYDEYCCGNSYSNGVAARVIGSFHLEKRRRYSLGVQILEDGSALAAAEPHLMLEESGDVAETGSWVEWLLLLPCGTLIIFGLILIVLVSVRGKPRRTVTR